MIKDLTLKSVIRDLIINLFFLFLLFPFQFVSEFETLSDTRYNTAFRILCWLLIALFVANSILIAFVLVRELLKKQKRCLNILLIVLLIGEAILLIGENSLFAQTEHGTLNQAVVVNKYEEDGKYFLSAQDKAHDKIDICCDHNTYQLVIPKQEYMLICYSRFCLTQTCYLTDIQLYPQ